MATKKQRILKIIREFNEAWDLNIVISNVVFWNRVGAAYRPLHSKGWIYVNADLNIQELEQDVLHELGHALIHQYKIHLSKLRLFHEGSPKYSMPFIERMHLREEQPPPKGFVSWYATYNGTEDFCETLSAYVSNNCSLKRMYYFENDIPVRDQPKLQRKLREVHSILGALGQRSRAA